MITLAPSCRIRDQVSGVNLSKAHMGLGVMSF